MAVFLCCALAMEHYDHVLVMFWLGRILFRVYLCHPNWNVAVMFCSFSGLVIPNQNLTETSGLGYVLATPHQNITATFYFTP